MALIQLREASISFGDVTILDGAHLEIEKRSKMALLGRNGQGKSSLLKLLLGEYELQAGEKFVLNQARVAYLPQEVPEDITGTVRDNVGSFAGENWSLFQSYQKAVEDEDFGKVEKLSSKVEDAGLWDLQSKIESICDQLGLNPDQEVSEMSGGNKRRVLLAGTILQDPDVLLLDEPTNHLDIDSILKLESFLQNWKKALFLVSHDRAFLEAICNTMVELDRGKLYAYDCKYAQFEKRREERLHAEEMENQLFDKRLSEEEVWIRQGIKARRTRNMGRVRSLLKMREESQQRVNLQGKVQLNTQESGKSGREVVNLKDLHFAFENTPIVEGFSHKIMRKDRIALLGPNGCGKSTLLKLFLGQLPPQKGSVELGTNLEVVYFDQMREQLDPEKTVAQNVSPHAEMVDWNGGKRHIYSYLKDFLFTAERAKSPARVLSGGEKNRLLLARLFLKPFNLLILDEPTNDLDMETLDMLEEMLMEYEGTLILVSHDRDFVDRVATSTLVWEGVGQWKSYVGGYQDYLRQRPQREAPKKAEKPKVAEVPAAEKKEKKKRSYKENREFEELPERIDQLESKLEELNQLMQDPDFYKNANEDIVAKNQELEETQAALDHAYERWEILDSLEG